MRIIALILLLAAPALAEETTLTSFGPFTAKLPADMLEGEADGTARTFTNEGIRLVVEQGPGVSLAAYGLDAKAGLKKVPVEVDGIPTEMLVIQEKGQLIMAMQLAAPDSDEVLAMVVSCEALRARIAAGKILYSVDYAP